MNIFDPPYICWPLYIFLPPKFFTTCPHFESSTLIFYIFCSHLSFWFPTHPRFFYLCLHFHHWLYLFINFRSAGTFLIHCYTFRIPPQIVHACYIFLNFLFPLIFLNLLFMVQLRYILVSLDCIFGWPLHSSPLAFLPPTLIFYSYRTLLLTLTFLTLFCIAL